MIRMAIFGSAAALAFSLPAAAQSYAYSGQGYDGYGYQGQGYYNGNCEQERSNNKAAGTIVGAIAGGLIGAAIADDGDDRHRYRGHRYKRNYHRGYRHGYRHHRDNDGDQVAGALIGGVVGAIAGNAIAGSASSNDCVNRVYNNAPQANPRYGGMNVAPPTRQAYSNDWRNDAQPVRLNQPQGGYGEYGLRDGEELYGGNYADPHYGAETGATVTGYNTGYTAPRDTGECRTVYRDRYINGQRVSEPATACNVGGDRWEFVE